MVIILPDLLGEREHFFAVDIQDLVSSHDDVEASSVPALIAVAFYSIPGISKN